MIAVRGAAKIFVARGAEVPALLPTDLDIPSGRFVSFVGPSGCGKSTLLNMIAGIVAPSYGEIEHDGAVVSGINRNVGYMTQADSLLPWRSAEENVSLPLILRGWPRDRIAARVDSMLAMVGLTKFRRHFPAELSGGMRKRVALAQVLAYDPGTLLMDEPFGALDAQLKLVMQNELARIWDDTRKTIVFVTHDLAEAIALSDEVVIFSGRPGRIKSVRKIDLPRPRDVFRLQFDPAFRALYNELWDALAPEIGAEARA
ncbi:ABC transporter ATP-binding protein [Ferrovibrio sp.]|uniref:ABC transporter ATP-binding protein n=1 Tax=Ferrovibrio sp. TaxID=1917215 RepID=UPI003513FEF3